MVKSDRIVALAVFLVVIPLSLLAAPPKYQVSSELTLQGEPVYVAEHPSHASWTGLYAIMRDGAGEIEVHFAPVHFLADHGIKIERGTSIKVIGSRVRWDGNEIILAREVTVDGKSVAIRDKDGSPRW